MNKPNFLIILADQLRADVRKSMGGRFDVMPFLDSISSEGVDFSKAYTSCPLCVPARTSLLTGRYPSSTRVRTNQNRYDAFYSKDLIDIARDNGYVTALIGKTHSYLNCDTALDYVRVYSHLGNMGEENTSDEERAFASFLAKLRMGTSMEPSIGGVESQHPYRCVSDAIEFLTANKGKPFLTFISFPEPHPPYQVCAPYFDFYPPELFECEIDDAVLAFKGSKYEWMMKTYIDRFGSSYPEYLKRGLSNYYGMIRLIDDQLQRLFDELVRLKLYDDTYIIFLSDHGDFAGQYGFMRKGPGLSQALTRIPLYWKGPGICAMGKKDNVYVSIVDVLPTVCSLMGVSIPAGVQGKSLLPIMSGGDYPTGEFDSVYCESGYGGHYWTDEDSLTMKKTGDVRPSYREFDTLNSWTLGGFSRMVTKDNWSLEIDMEGAGYLYNLSPDKKEINNLFHDSNFFVKREELEHEMLKKILQNSETLPYPEKKLFLKTHPKGYWNERFMS